MATNRMVGSSRATVLASRAFLVVMAVAALFPLVWGFLTSVKVDSEIVSIPPKWLPSQITWNHYAHVLTGSDLPRYLLNSAAVATGASILAVTVGLVGGYSAARMQFRGQGTILLIVLAASMVPGIAVLVPLYKMGVNLGLHNTYLYLILVFAAWQMPMVLWMLRGFIMATAREVEESALIDGCSRFGAFVRVTIPQLRPGITAAAMIVFVFVWNDWLIATILTSTSDKTLVQPGLFRYVGDAGVRWGDFMAYVMVAVAPIVLAFTRLEKFFVSGLSAGATKG